MKNKLDKDFWNNRYLSKDIGWDIGNISTPIKDYIDQLENKELKILIPGAGNGYEAEYLFSKGFKNVYILDIAPEAIESFRKRVPAFPADHIICANFFEHKNQYDLIIEQTFFCALNPELRNNYVLKVKDLLKPGGKLVGLLFDDNKLNNDQPPFGGSKEEYLKLFVSFFKIRIMDAAYNSIAPRAGRELFIILEKI